MLDRGVTCTAVMAYILPPLPRGPPTFLSHRWAERFPGVHVTRVECKNLWHKVARFHICLATTDSTRRHNGAAPVAGSAPAARQGTTWDHRAADLCMNHVLSPAQTHGADISGAAVLVLAAPGDDRRRQETTGDDRRRDRDITYSGTCLLPPSVTADDGQVRERRTC